MLLWIWILTHQDSHPCQPRDLFDRGALEHIPKYRDCARINPHVYSKCPFVSGLDNQRVCENSNLHKPVSVSLSTKPKNYGRCFCSKRNTHYSRLPRSGLQAFCRLGGPTLSETWSFQYPFRELKHLSHSQNPVSKWS